MDVPSRGLPPLRTIITNSQKDADLNEADVPPKSPWVLGLCSVLFDVDKGQTLQDLWPLDCLSEEEKAAVAFHAFPDSLSMELYTRNAVRDSSFTFRIKREPESYSSAGVPDFLYGYVFCRQRQDETLRRGGEQVSVLVLSTMPFSGALMPLSQAAGHAFFNEGPIALAMLYNQVLSWPPPVPGSSMCLPMGAGVLNTRLPHFCIMPPPQPVMDPSVQASLGRRLSRALSIKAGGSPRTPAATAAAAAAAAGAGPNASSSPQQSGAGGAPQPDTPAEETAAAAAAAGAMPEQPLEPQVQQTVEGASTDTAGTGHSSSSEAGVPAAAAADASSTLGPAADDGGWAMVAQEPQPQQTTAQEQQQQQSPARGLSSGGSFSSLLGLSFSSSRVGSSSRLSRQDLSTAGKSGSSLDVAAAGDSNGNGVTGSASTNSSSASTGTEWLAATLGQQWRDEKPFPEVEPALVLAPLLRDLWTLWQLVVTGQPLMVVGLNPGETSAAVAALTSLIAPLPYAADFRPFFTIHDPDFVALASGQLPKRQRYHEVLPVVEQQAVQEPQQVQQPGGTDSKAASQGGDVPQAPLQQQAADQQQQEEPPQLEQQPKASRAAAAVKQWNLPALIGITNLYFIKALPKWPNVVAVSKKEIPAAAPVNSSRSDATPKPSTSSGGAAPPEGTSAGGATSGAAGAAGSPGSASPVPPAGSRYASGFLSATAAAAMRAIQRRHQGPQHLLSHFAPHLWTCSRHVQCVKPDYTLLSKARAAIEPAVGSVGGVVPAAGSSGSSGSSGNVSGPGGAAGTVAARLRRHFAELTAGLLAPFEVYFTPGANGKVPAWRPEAFLTSLDPATLNPTLTARLSGNAGSAARTLYAAFIDSPNFAFWFKQRRAPVLHLVEQPESDDDEGFAEVAPGEGDSSDAGVKSEPDEVELVQQLLSTEQALLDWQQQQQQEEEEEEAQRADKQLQQQEQALQYQFVQVFRQLDRDLQAALFSSPPRQELLQHAAAALAGGSSAEQEAAAAVLQKMQELLISADRGGDDAAD